MNFAITHCDYKYLIGCDDKLAYSARDDFAEFKLKTMGKTLVMGRKTYTECGNLPGRNILCLSRSGNLLNGSPTILEVEDLEEFVLCGGSEIYFKYLHLCEIVYINYTNLPRIKNPINPTYFPHDLLMDNFKVGSHKNFTTFTQRTWLLK